MHHSGHKGKVQRRESSSEPTNHSVVRRGERRCAEWWCCDEMDGTEGGRSIGVAKSVTSTWHGGYTSGPHLS